MFDSDLGFMPPLQALSCRATWEALTCNSASLGDTNLLKAFRVYAFKADAMSDVANFLSDYEGIISGVCMTAQKQVSIGPTSDKRSDQALEYL